MSDRESSPTQQFVEPLTRREQEVLNLLAQGLSAAEIAQQLTLAVSSVKWYIQQLYSKLGVNNKQRALVRAAALDLLDGTGPGRERKSPTRPKHNLPLQVTRFFGREQQVAELKERLGEERLVTLSGSAGVGKTRLSLRAAEELVDEFPDGVWLVELAPLTDPNLVPQQVAAVLLVHDEPGGPVLDRLSSHLRERQVLLVLDNCEHLLTACARLADHLLRGCPRLRLLASSREPLSIPGEAVIVVPPLPFPRQPIALEHMDNYAAVRLFIDRARLVLPNYQVDAANAAALVRICERLDGIPLALELAAARLRAVDSQVLASRLDDVFRVITGGSRTAPPRQQTLRATLDWSYNLMTDAERLLLQHLSVFAGGFTLAAAEAVCPGSPQGKGIMPGDVLDLLASLVAKSMVNTGTHTGHGTRYHLLETVRQYAREKLTDASQSSRVRTLHLDYYGSLADTLVQKYATPEQRIWDSRLRAELENLRLALHWAFSDPCNHTNVETGLRLFSVIRKYEILTDR